MSFVRTNLIDGTWIGNRIRMLDNGYRFTCQDGLIDPEGGREDFAKTNISWDLVTDGHLNDVPGNDLFRSNPLYASLVTPHNLTHFGFILLQRLDRRFGVTFLPNTDHRVGDKNEQNNEGLDEGRKRILVLLK